MSDFTCISGANRRGENNSKRGNSCKSNNAVIHTSLFVQTESIDVISAFNLMFVHINTWKQKADHYSSNCTTLRVAYWQTLWLYNLRYWCYDVERSTIKKTTKVRNLNILSRVVYIQFKSSFLPWTFLNRKPVFQTSHWEIPQTGFLKHNSI